MKIPQNYKVLMIMFATSFVLLAFSFFIFHRRGNTPIPQGQETNDLAAIPEKEEYEWADFDSKGAGVAFKYPKNIFTNPDTQSVTAGSVTRVFFGTSNNGTLAVSSVKRQFEPGNIIDPATGKTQKASAISVGGKIGYQYQTQSGTCTNRIVQVANGSEIVVFNFASCVSDDEPKVATNNDLFLQTLASVKLTPQAPVEPEPEPAVPDDSGMEGIDTLPPGVEAEL